MERLRFWRQGGQDDVDGPRPTCPSTNLCELRLSKGSPVLWRRGVRLGAAGEKKHLSLDVLKSGGSAVECESLFDDVKVCVSPQRSIALQNKSL